MNLRDLHYIVAVAQHGHFSKAAEACHVSQPALSMQVLKLEESLGVQLFERSHKTVRITEVGQEIVARAQKMLQEAEEIKEVAKTYQDPLAGKFKLGAFPTLAPYLLPHIVPLIHRKLPKLNLLLVEEKTQVLLDMLKTGLLDAALIALPISDPELQFKVLFEDPFLLAVPKGHALAKKKKVELRDIENDALLLLEEGHCLRAQALEVCHLAQAQQQEFRATSLETLRQMVVAHAGITLIPKIAVRPDPYLVYLPFKGHPPSRTIALVWRKNAAKSASASTIYDIVCADLKHR